MSEPRQPHGRARNVPALVLIALGLAGLVVVLFTVVVEPRVNSLEVYGADYLRGPSTESQPLRVGLASLRNDSSGEMQLLDVTDRDHHELGDGFRFGVTRNADPAGVDIVWFSREHPVTIASDDSVWLWVSIAIPGRAPEGFEGLQVHFRDELPWERTAEVHFGVMAVPENMPAGIDSFDSGIDSIAFSEYLDAFVLAMDGGDPATVAFFLGPDATRADAQKFLKDQGTIDAAAGYMWNAASNTTAEVQFSRIGYIEFGPTFVISWSHNRWFVSPFG